MSVIAAAEPILAGNNLSVDFRPRPSRPDAVLAPDSTPPADRSAKGFADRDKRQQEQPSRRQEELPRGAMFAAAVIAGRLSPRPETINELYQRIGKSWVPPESELRLRDFSV